MRFRILETPLILDPVPNPLMENMKSKCIKFERQHGKVNMRLSTDWSTLRTRKRLYFRVIVQTS